MFIAATSSLDSSASMAAAASAPGSTGVSSADSEKRFLKLLVTQLKNQDPLNPLDNAQLTSQLAQLSAVTGIEKLNTTLQALVSQSGAGQVLQAASLIGRTVLVAGNDLALKQGAEVPFAVDMPGAAESVKATITNAAGQTVRSYDLGTLPQGVKTLSWDGLADNGAPVAAGSYSINVVATGGGAAVAASALTYQQVASVSQGASGVSLDLASGRKASLSDVKLIL